MDVKKVGVCVGSEVVVMGSCVGCGVEAIVSSRVGLSVVVVGGPTAGLLVGTSGGKGFCPTPFPVRKMGRAMAAITMQVRNRQSSTRTEVRQNHFFLVLSSMPRAGSDSVMMASSIGISREFIIFFAEVSFMSFLLLLVC